MCLSQLYNFGTGTMVLRYGSDVYLRMRFICLPSHSKGIVGHAGGNTAATAVWSAIPNKASISRRSSLWAAWNMGSGVIVFIRGAVYQSKYPLDKGVLAEYCMICHAHSACVEGERVILLTPSRSAPKPWSSMGMLLGSCWYGVNMG